MTERNALAELAERLKNHLEATNAVSGFDQQVWRDFRKALRIVAELAKVEDWVTDSGADEPLAYSSISAVKECRAIAEEGVEK